jgi:hypothetical protein
MAICPSPVEFIIRESTGDAFVVPFGAHSALAAERALEEPSSSRSSRAPEALQASGSKQHQLYSPLPGGTFNTYGGEGPGLTQDDYWDQQEDDGYGLGFGDNEEQCSECGDGAADDDLHWFEEDFSDSEVFAQEDGCQHIMGSLGPGDSIDDGGEPDADEQPPPAVAQPPRDDPDL